MAGEPKARANKVIPSPKAGKRPPQRVEDWSYLKFPSATQSPVIRPAGILVPFFPGCRDPGGQEITAQSVEAHALDTFGSAVKAEHWLSRPNPVFQGKTPRQIIKVEPSAVEAALVRIDHGVYI